MKKKPWFCLILLLPFVTSFARAQEDEKPWCVSVWHPSSQHPDGYTTLMNHLDLIHEVNPFWYTPLPDGRLQTTHENPEHLAAWREAGKVIIPTIFSGLSEVITEPALRDQHIQNIVALVEEKNYDGIEIDYEGFTTSTRDDFSLFIEQLAGQLHAKNRLLGIAVHAKTDDAGAWEGAAAQDWVRLAAAVDIFKIMTYDYSSQNSPPGPIGPPQWAHDVIGYAATVTDLSKVRLGLHFYGYSWRRGSPPASAMTWDSTQNWIQSLGVEITRDPADQEARIDLDVRGLPKQTVYVADAVSIDYKLRMMVQAYPDLGGLSIWGLGGEDPANWDVLAKFASGHCELLFDNSRQK